MGCREREAKTALLRVVSDGDRLVPDPGGRLPGRGASVHLDPRCVDLAEKRRAFPRALRTDGPLDLSLLRETVREALGNRSTDPTESSSSMSPR
ncbi:MAG: YlxR family protein [Mycobacteriales bacterium]